MLPLPKVSLTEEMCIAAVAATVTIANAVSAVTVTTTVPTATVTTAVPTTVTQVQQNSNEQQQNSSRVAAK